MSFTSKSSDTISTLVKLQGNPLNYVQMLKRRLEDVTGKELHKGAAVALLLNKIPKDAIEHAIKQIVEKQRKPSKH